MFEITLLLLTTIFLSLKLENKFKIPAPITTIIISILCKQFIPTDFNLSDSKVFAELVIFLIPLLILSDAIVLKPSELKKNKWNIIYLAIFGIIISVLFGILISKTILSEYNLSIGATITLFSMVLATDPVSVVSIFGIFPKLPHKLKILAEGESLFNDAIALILFAGFGLHMIEGNKLTFSYAATASFQILVVSIIIGIIFGIIGTLLLKTSVSKNKNILMKEELIIILGMAYFSFYISEHIHVIGNNHLSGILSEIVVILVINTFIEKQMKTLITKVKNEQKVVEIANKSKKANRIKNIKKFLRKMTSNIVEQDIFIQNQNNIALLAMFGNTILFILLGQILNIELLLKYWKEIITMFLVTTIIRSIVMGKFAFLSTKTSKLTNVNMRWWSILLFSGIKGGLSIVMLQMIPDTFIYKEMFKAIVIGVILLSIILYSIGLILIIKLNEKSFEKEYEQEQKELEGNYKII